MWEAEDDDGVILDVPYTLRYYTTRNYSLFAILAGVRNGLRGDFGPIAAPKGIPADASPEVTRLAAQRGEWVHDHSWLTLAEIFAYDWTQVVTQHGYVDAEHYYLWTLWGRDHGEPPQRYANGVTGDIVTEEEMVRYIARILDTESRPYRAHVTARIAEELAGVYCDVAWVLPYHSLCLGFWGNVVPRLLRLGPPEKVRIVFWFDS
jgi:hypothetical protein